MPGKEVLLTEFCPGCAGEGNAESRLRTQIGVFGTFCENRKHMYSDTLELRSLIAEMKKGSKAAAAAVAVEDAPAPISTLEPRAFELSEVDAGRLSELLGQPVTDSGTLVGLVYALKMDQAQLTGDQERRELAPTPREYTVNPLLTPRADGGLGVQIYVPAKQSALIYENAKFNGVTVVRYVQDLLEYRMNASYFPCDVSGPPRTPDFEGCWLLVTIPEAYLSTAVDKAKSAGMEVVAYTQAYIDDLIDLELFP